MSTKSKTGAKLVDSIRKSKTGTVASKTSDRPAATAAKPKTAASKPATNSQSKPTQGANIDFSHSRRVWPD